MKLAACYTIFNGLELLEKSIEQIKPFVDEIIICWQKTSNKGNVSHEIEDFCHTLRGKNYKIIEFIPDLRQNTKQNERNKHQLMIDLAKKLNCTHFFISATDHFYEPDAFGNALYTTIHHDWDVTFTKMFTYYKHPTWQLTPIEDYLCPFICKLYPHTKVERVPNYPAHVDPSLQYTTCNYSYIFDQDYIMMHHFSMIRQDIKNKFKNAAASMRWKEGDIERFVSEYENYSLKENQGISYFGGRKIKEVDDYFNLDQS